MNWYKKAQIDLKYLIELFNLLHLKYKNSNIDFNNSENPQLSFGYNEGIMFYIYYDQRNGSIVVEKRNSEGWQDCIAKKSVNLDGDISKLNMIVEEVSKAVKWMDSTQ